MRRIAAVDFGLKRIGLAISDPQGIVALPLKMLLAGSTPIQNVLDALAPYKNELKTILVGLPLLLSGAKGDMALTVERFAAGLHAASNLPVECVDERFTTAAAERALKEMNQSRKKRTKSIDSLSATLLLQAYLDKHS